MTGGVGVLASIAWCEPADPAVVTRLVEDAPFSLPDDYLAFLAEHDGGQVILGDWFVFLWKAEQLLEFNRRYEVELSAPGLFLIGSNGCGDAYGLDLRPEGRGEAVLVPFVGMSWSQAEVLAPEFGVVLLAIAERAGVLVSRDTGENPVAADGRRQSASDHDRGSRGQYREAADRPRMPAADHAAGSSGAGRPPTDDPGAALELWAVRPLYFGGSGTDPTNNVWLSREAHFDMVTYWNRKVRILEGREDGPL